MEVLLEQDGFAATYIDFKGTDSPTYIEGIKQREKDPLEYDIDKLKAKGEIVLGEKDYKYKKHFVVSFYYACIVSGSLNIIIPARKNKGAISMLVTRGESSIFKFKGEDKKTLKPQLRKGAYKRIPLEDSRYFCLYNKNVETAGDYIELIDPKQHKVKADSYLFVFDGSGTLNGNAIESFLYTDVLENDEVDCTSMLALLIEKN